MNFVFKNGPKVITIIQRLEAQETEIDPNLSSLILIMHQSTRIFLKTFKQLPENLFTSDVSRSANFYIILLLDGIKTIMLNLIKDKSNHPYQKFKRKIYPK